ncbi:hypothetical protein PMY38_10085 [Clostridium tertium]|uniref:hypothetical protein n=1 Tax=Clostridium tertium TaxID=1559 RepID=UPI00232E1FFE|nr:hypothetical protein [Clostridium tertium]MDB1955391.1 hypothetical protein [Clostridium tertium]MDB1958947.1 hypothetical protein [Clostridium tertium]MDB1963823.1 hypothetical protein [Clostridium tertium]MDB1966086.1 hypothetical protein [Clostridium tertium]
MNNCRENFKLREERKGGLVNLILNYAIENSMALKEVDECVEIAKEVYYSDAVIKRTAPEVPVQEQLDSSITTKLGNSKVVIEKDGITIEAAEIIIQNQ